ncbi:hypothetical protein ACWGA4_21990 [Streptomyces rubiginosohelvolus]
MSAGARARAGVLTGGVLVAAGVWVGVAMAAGLVTAGVLLVAYCLLLMDVGGGSP